MPDSPWPDFNEAIDGVAATGAPTVAHLISPGLTSFAIDLSLHIDGKLVTGPDVVAAARNSDDDVRTRALNRIALQAPNSTALGALAREQLRSALETVSPEERTDFVWSLKALPSSGVTAVLADLGDAPPIDEPADSDDAPPEEPSAAPVTPAAPPVARAVQPPTPPAASSRGPYLLAAIAAVAAVIAAMVALSDRTAPTPPAPTAAAPTVTVTHTDRTTVIPTPTATATAAPARRIGAGESFAAGTTHCAVDSSAIICDIAGLTLETPIASCYGTGRFPRYATAPDEAWAQWSSLPGVDVCFIQTHMGHSPTAYPLSPGESVYAAVGNATLVCSRGSSTDSVTCHDATDADDWFRVGPQGFVANH